MGKTVAFDKKEIVEIIRTLSIFLRARDKIRSAEPENDVKRALLFEVFMTETSMFKKLARARRNLNKGFSSKAEKDGMDELERALADTTYWKVPYEKTEKQLVSDLNKIKRKTGLK